jgi:tripartite ATP-independent transporter DctM subunit
MGFFMFGLLLVGMATGFPIAWVTGGVAIISAVLFWGPQAFNAFYQQAYGALSAYVLLAVPLFLLMGTMVEQAKIGDKLFNFAYLMAGGIRGGLGALVILVGVVLALCMGVISGSIAILAIVALPTLIRHGYKKELACGAIMASGCLGIFIPPSVLLVIYGPVANISVGRLFTAAFIPGFLLAAMYIVYILVRCFMDPESGPPMRAEERVAIPFKAKIRMFVASAMPVLILIMSVLVAIYMGIATPTEAAALGALVSILLALSYRQLSYKVVSNALRQTFSVTAMIMFTVFGALMFQTVFLGLGCGDVFKELILAVPFGKWASFAVIMIIIFILGFFLVDLAIVLIMVPLVTPIGTALGFDPVWMAMMVCLNIQTSYLTPPFAQAIFFLSASVNPSLGITTGHIIRGAIPFVVLIIATMALCVAFPEIITWLPNTMK